MESAPLVKFHKVSKFYGHKPVLRDITFTVEKGNLILVTGDNGAGKSTLLRLVAGLGKPTSGAVVKKDNLRMTYLGHATFLYPAMTALENLAFWASINGIYADRKMLKGILERMNLLAHASARAGFFSRGMAQRLNFARLLLGTPELALLDEPFSGVDKPSRILMQAELDGLRKAGAAILMVSHDPGQDAPNPLFIFHISQARLEVSSMASA